MTFLSKLKQVEQYYTDYRYVDLKTICDNNDNKLSPEGSYPFVTSGAPSSYYSILINLVKSIFSEEGSYSLDDSRTIINNPYVDESADLKYYRAKYAKLKLRADKLNLTPNHYFV